MMDNMMKKGKSMCDAMMSDMGGMDAMMAKGKSMCADMMGPSDNSSCPNNNEDSSCSTGKNATVKEDSECCSNGSCEL